MAIKIFAFCGQKTGYLKALGLPDPDFLLQNESLLEEGIVKGTSQLLDDLDMLQACIFTQSQNCVHSKLRELLLLVVQKLRAESCPRDVQQILFELLLVRLVVYCRIF